MGTQLQGVPVGEWYRRSEANRLCRSLLRYPQRSYRRRIMRAALLNMLANLGEWLGVNK